MKKKILILTVLVLTLTGCSAEYNLEINENSYNESVNIYLPKYDFSNDSINGILENKTPITQNGDEKKYYSNSVSENDNNYIINENYNHSFDTITSSYFITRCYGGNVIKKRDNLITINTDSEFKCINMDDGAKVDSVQINIKTNQKVLSNNADAIKGNTYTWNINEDNYLNKPINMEIRIKGKTFTNSQIEMAIIFSIIVLVGALIYLFVKGKKEKNNSI